MKKLVAIISLLLLMSFAFSLQAQSEKLKNRLAVECTNLLLQGIFIHRNAESDAEVRLKIC